MTNSDCSTVWGGKHRVAQTGQQFRAGSTEQLRLGDSCGREHRTTETRRQIRAGSTELLSLGDSFGREALSGLEGKLGREITRHYVRRNVIMCVCMCARMCAGLGYVGGYVRLMCAASGSQERYVQASVLMCALCAPLCALRVCSVLAGCFERQLRAGRGRWDGEGWGAPDRLHRR